EREIDGRRTTIRQQLGLFGTRLRFDELKNFPYLSFRIGTGTVVITADNKIVVAIRSEKEAIAPSGYHLSVAEGMFESDTEPAISRLFETRVTSKSRRTPS